MQSCRPEILSPFPSLSFDQYTATSLTLVYLQRIVNVEWDKGKTKKQEKVPTSAWRYYFLSIADRFSLEKYINKIKKHPPLPLPKNKFYTNIAVRNILDLGCA